VPSVETVWRGRCVNRPDQQALCEQMLDLARVSDDLHKTHGGGLVNTIIYDGQKVYNRVLILKDIFGSSIPASRMKEIDKGIYLVEDIRLFGLVFSLFDPRYPSSSTGFDVFKRISFVFTRSEKPELDGWIVSPERVYADHPWADQVQEVLCINAMVLRYYLEDQMSKVLGWVKHYYIPDLYYWLNEDCPGYQHFWKVFPKDRAKGIEQFQKLLGEFRREGELFAEKTAELQRELETGQEGLATKTQRKNA